jgi:hypothetical protein
MTLGMAVSSAMFPYIRNVVVLMYFTKRSRIEAFNREIELSNWPKLSENQGARTTACTAAAERISEPYENLKSYFLLKIAALRQVLV